MKDVAFGGQLDGGFQETKTGVKTMWRQGLVCLGLRPRGPIEDLKGQCKGRKPIIPNRFYCSRFVSGKTELKEISDLALGTNSY